MKVIVTLIIFASFLSLVRGQYGQHWRKGGQYFSHKFNLISFYLEIKPTIILGFWDSRIRLARRNFPQEEDLVVPDQEVDVASGKIRSIKLAIRSYTLRCIFYLDCRCLPWKLGLL